MRQFLQRAIAQRSLGHAILLAGPQSIGKRTLALDLTAALLCNAQPGDPCWECIQCKGVLRQQHPDLHLVELEEGRKSIRMEQVAALQRAVALRPYQAAQRVSLIFDAHLLQPEASQRLLKTLEEPPPHNTLVLTATSTHLLPQTLLSRCQVWRLTALPQRLVQSTLEQRGFRKRMQHFSGPRAWDDWGGQFKRAYIRNCASKRIYYPRTCGNSPGRPSCTNRIDRPVAK